MTMQLKKDMQSMGQLDEMLHKYGPTQVVDALKECLIAWAQLAADGVERHDEKAMAEAEIESTRLLQAADGLEGTLHMLRRLGL